MTFCFCKGGLVKDVESHWTFRNSALNYLLFMLAFVAVSTQIACVSQQHAYKPKQIQRPLTELTSSLKEQGLEAIDRNDLVLAEKCFRQEYEVEHELGIAEEAGSLYRLGLLAALRFDWAQANEYASQAKAIRETLPFRASAPNILSLATYAGRRGDFAKAQEYVRDALVIEGSASSDVATTLESLGIQAAQREDLSKAEAYFRQVVALRKRSAPGSIELAASLNALGDMVRAYRGRLSEAEGDYSAALSIYNSLMPAGAARRPALTASDSLQWTLETLSKPKNIFVGHSTSTSGWIKAVLLPLFSLI